MGEKVMADVQMMDEEIEEAPAKVDKKAAKKAAQEKKKAEKKAKKAESDSLDDESDGIGTKIATFFVTLIIILIWVAIIVMLIKWDVGGFGSGVLAPLLKNVPYVNEILPDAAVSSTEDSAYSYASVDEAVERIKELEIELAEAQNGTSKDAEEIADLQEKAAELEAYKADEEAFEEEKEKFYNEVVFSSVAPDIEEYKSYYESIDPANAEAIYRQVVQQTAADDELSDYVKTYSSMKAKEAAAVFDSMTDNLSLVAQILENMDAQSRADILGKMDSDTAAKVTEIMKP
jgi:flagellar motility protein MotE (MotC chaperone)